MNEKNQFKLGDILYRRPKEQLTPNIRKDLCSYFSQYDMIRTVLVTWTDNKAGEEGFTFGIDFVDGFDVNSKDTLRLLRKMRGDIASRMKDSRIRSMLIVNNFDCGPKPAPREFFDVS